LKDIEMQAFQTTDLYLASALKISGFRLIDLKRDEKDRGVFFFEERSDRPQIVRKYFSGELMGSLKAFSNAWADLKSLVNQIEIEREQNNDWSKQ
jgi:Domain of unknown function (DUF5659)